MIRSRVRCREMHGVDERAAEYVVYDGLPEEVMLRLLDELDEAERKGNLRGDRRHKKRAARVAAKIIKVTAYNNARPRK